MAEKKCLVCGSSNLTELLTATDFLVSSDEFRIAKCTDCGFTFTLNPPDERELGQYYLSEDYISHTDRKESLTESIYHAVRRLMLHRKYKLIKGLSRKGPGTLLDIGSGTGYFAGYMKNRGWEVTGIEISERARNFSISKFSMKAISPDKVKDLSDGEFDYVTLWHVLEHLSDPVMWLKEIFRVLKDDGKCIVAMPNISSADSKKFGKNWAALDVPRHLWHFSPETLQKFIKDKGFICSRITGMPFDVFYISIMSYRYCQTRFAFLRGLTTGMILTLKNLFVGNSSSSLIYILEKQKP
jgi:2-polyprenyl-3-methyl-5-hydroxy-6-metoxy-1,4-benzoquinol methylase